MSEQTNREIHLKSRPAGLPTADNFALVETPIPQPGPGQALVRNIYMSVDPYMRGRMNEQRGYAAPFQIDRPLYGGCVGQVVEANGRQFQVGDYVLGGLGWREYFVADEKQLSKIEPSIAPIQAFLGTTGMPGKTAYFGLLDIGKPQAGETVFVSAASGAVGSIVCQIAKIKGCRVVGSAGSAQKVAWLKEVAGVDAAFNYKQVDHLTKTVAALCPDGIDIYFENVGGAHLETALTLMNPHGRIPLCGMIAHYNQAGAVSGPGNLALAIGKRILIQGYIVSDYYDREAEFYADMGPWIAEGKIKWQETIVEGVENAPQAFIGLFSGQNMGKMLVKLGPDPSES